MSIDTSKYNYYLRPTTKSNVSIRSLIDIEENGGDSAIVDGIKRNQVLVAQAYLETPTTYGKVNAFRFKYLDDLIKPGTGISITESNGEITITSTSAGDMLKSMYDTDLDGVVDQAECVKIIVRNSTGVTLTKGQVVYLLGATGNRPNAVLADASTEATSSKTIGLVSADIANNADGYVTVSGTMHDLALNMFADGDRLWLDSTPGDMVANTPPAEPNHSVFIGTVARAHPTQGRLVLAIQNGYELNELHGVQVSSEADNDIIYYQGSTGLWKNKQMPVVNIITTTDGTAVTGTTTSTLTSSILIPANTVAVGDIIYVKTRIRKTGTLGVVTTRMYVNTSSAIGGSLIATSAAAASQILFFQYTRTLAVKTTTNTETMAGNANINADDNTGITIAVSTNNIDWTQNQYIVVAVQNGSTGDSSRSSFIHAQINKI
jgi:hypothetical protein